MTGREISEELRATAHHPSVLQRDQRTPRPLTVWGADRPKLSAVRLELRRGCVADQRRR